MYISNSIDRKNVSNQLFSLCRSVVRCGKRQLQNGFRGHCQLYDDNCQVLRTLWSRTRFHLRPLWQSLRILVEFGQTSKIRVWTGAKILLQLLPVQVQTEEQHAETCVAETQGRRDQGTLSHRSEFPDWVEWFYKDFGWCSFRRWGILYVYKRRML